MKTDQPICDICFRQVSTKEPHECVGYPTTGIQAFKYTCNMLCPEGEGNTDMHCKCKKVGDCVVKYHDDFKDARKKLSDNNITTISKNTIEKE